MKYKVRMYIGGLLSDSKYFDTRDEAKLAQSKVKDVIDKHEGAKVLHTCLVEIKTPAERSIA